MVKPRIVDSDKPDSPPTAVAYINDLLKVRGLTHYDIRKMYRRYLITNGEAVRTVRLKDHNLYNAFRYSLRLDYDLFATVVTSFLGEQLPDDPVLLKHLQLPANIRDIIGQVFGRLTVIDFGRVESSNGAYWRCKCTCGNTTTVKAWDLQDGNTRSCGCLSRETASLTHLKHGASSTREYTVWNALRRTIKVRPKWSSTRTISERWNTFENFLEDMGECPTGERLILKPGADEYCKENCFWGTTKRVGVAAVVAEAAVVIDGIPAEIWARANGVPYDQAVEDHFNGFKPNEIICRRCTDLG